eukprot:1899583-Prymnesium_polylepis.1
MGFMKNAVRAALVLSCYIPVRQLPLVRDLMTEMTRDMGIGKHRLARLAARYNHDEQVIVPPEPILGKSGTRRDTSLEDVRQSLQEVINPKNSAAAELVSVAALPLEADSE